VSADATSASSSITSATSPWHPHAYADIQENDAEFAATSYLKAIAWLKDDADDLYDPSYGDVIRVAGLLGFSRGKASSIVSELSGRDPETRKVDEARIPVAYDTLESALLAVVKSTTLRTS
jgi:hypothetical protein